MRLLTRADFDGLACAALLKDAGIVDAYTFVHPKDIQDGKIPVTDTDVLANVPYVPGCGLWFDHHSSEEERLRLMERFHFRGKSRPAPSCARVIYDHYGGESAFPKFRDSGFLETVDRSDSGNLTREEIVRPTGWVLLSFIMDPRTGLGRYKDYSVSNYQLMELLIDYCRSMSIDEILEVPDVKERVDRYFQQEKSYEEMITQNATVHGNVLAINLMQVEPILSGNRFKEYVLFPGQNISLRIIWGYRRQNVVFTCGYSILNRTASVDIGSLMLKYGGGGHRAVGTCQILEKHWENVREELIRSLKE